MVFNFNCNWNKELECKRGLMCAGCEHQPSDDDKENGKKEPVKINWRVDYGMKMPYCPSCGEMAYSNERCVFCGQKFIQAREPQNVKQYIGGVLDKDGTLKCEKCGSKKAELVSHADGSDHFDYTYRCECGNNITIRTMLGVFEEEEMGN